MIMWNELGLAGNRNYYFDCAVFRHQMGRKMESKKPMSHYWKERKKMSERKESERTRI